MSIRPDSESDPSADPWRDSDSVLPRTYGRTHGDGVPTLRDELTERNARETAKPESFDRGRASDRKAADAEYCDRHPLQSTPCMTCFNDSSDVYRTGRMWGA